MSYPCKNAFIPLSDDAELELFYGSQDQNFHEDGQIYIPSTEGAAATGRPLLSNDQLFDAAGWDYNSNGASSLASSYPPPTRSYSPTPSLTVTSTGCLPSRSSSVATFPNNSTALPAFSGAQQHNQLPIIDTLGFSFNYPDATSFWGLPSAQLPPPYIPSPQSSLPFVANEYWSTPSSAASFADYTIPSSEFETPSAEEALPSVDPLYLSYNPVDNSQLGPWGAPFYDGQNFVDDCNFFERELDHFIASSSLATANQEAPAISPSSPPPPQPIAIQAASDPNSPSLRTPKRNADATPKRKTATAKKRKRREDAAADSSAVHAKSSGVRRRIGRTRLAASPASAAPPDFTEAAERNPLAAWASADVAGSEVRQTGTRRAPSHGLKWLPPQVAENCNAVASHSYDRPWIEHTGEMDRSCTPGSSNVVQADGPVAGPSSLPDVGRRSSARLRRGTLLRSLVSTPPPDDALSIDNEDAPTTTKKRCPCPRRGCTITCGRMADLTRHLENVHGTMRGLCTLCGAKPSRKDYRHLKACAGAKMILVQKGLASLPAEDPRVRAVLRGLRDHMVLVNVEHEEPAADDDPSSSYAPAGREGS